MSQVEYFTARALSADSRSVTDWQDDEYLVRCGMSEGYVKKAKENRKDNKGVGRLFDLFRCNSIVCKQVYIGRSHSP